MHPHLNKQESTDYYKTLYDDSETKLNDSETQTFPKKNYKINPVRRRGFGNHSLISTQETAGSVKTHHAPGEFYTHYREELTPVLYYVFSYALSSGDLPKITV